jgi:DNA-binding Lrp family transcriptional regulator
MPPAKETSRRAVYEAVERGAASTSQVARATGLSSPTVRSRLKELEGEGVLTVDWRRGRGGGAIDVIGPLPDPASRDMRVATKQDQELGTPLPVAVLWVKADLASQARLAAELARTGAAAVLDCTGGFDLLATYPGRNAQIALRTARWLSDDAGVAEVTYGVIVGASHQAATSQH